MALTREEIELELRAVAVPATPVAANAQVRFGDSFEALSFDQCRRGHAEDALKNPRAIAAYEAGDFRMLAATKVVALPHGGAFVLIVIARDEREEGKGVEALAGFRLYGSASDEVAEDPSSAFAAFLDRYGAPYFTGGIESKFSSILLEPRRPDGLEFLSGPMPGE